MNKNQKTAKPDAALIEFLGDYEDAADGLDPLGLADHPEAAPDNGQDGHHHD